MGRGKIEIKRIENLNSRQVTFSKRRSGLLKKAKELAVLCDAEVGVIIFSSTGKLYDFSSTSMEHILSRYNRGMDLPAIPEIASNNELEVEVRSLKEELTRQRLAYLRVTGKELEGMNFKDLQLLENQLNEGLLSVKDKKEKLLMEQLKRSRFQEEKVAMENRVLLKQIEELRRVPTARLLEFNPLEMRFRQPPPNNADMGQKHDHSDTSLQLALMGPKIESKSNESCSQLITD